MEKGVFNYERTNSEISERLQKRSIGVLQMNLRDRPMREETEELFAFFETTGNRLQYEDVYFERRKYLATFGLACYLERRPEDIKKMEEILRGFAGDAVGHYQPMWIEKTILTGNIQ